MDVAQRTLQQPPNLRCLWISMDVGMDQYLLIPFLGGWTSIYQLFWGSLGTRVLTHCHVMPVSSGFYVNRTSTTPLVRSTHPSKAPTPSAGAGEAGRHSSVAPGKAAVDHWLVVPSMDRWLVGYNCLYNSYNLYLIWVNYNISQTSIKAIWGSFPLLTMIPVRSQWGHYIIYPDFIHHQYCIG